MRRCFHPISEPGVWFFSLRSAEFFRINVCQSLYSVSVVNKAGEVFVLGTGLSVSTLSVAEQEYINRSDCVLAMNKFMAFYAQSGLRPTHVYFVDHIEGSEPMLQYIFDVCIRDEIDGLTFILSKKHEYLVATNRLFSGPVNKAWERLAGNNRVFFQAPKRCRYEFVSREHYLLGGSWAKDISEPLFHYRGSLTSVLNYVTIKYPDRPIKLVGVDFNSPRHFFQESLESLDFAWQDWTTPIVADKGMHISALEHEGTTMFDRFDEVRKKLAETGNELYCCNENSLMVTKGCASYAPVIGY